MAQNFIENKWFRSIAWAVIWFIAGYVGGQVAVAIRAGNL